MRLKGVYISFLLLMRLSAQAQTLHFSHIGVDKGLSQSSVYTIFQDSRGFMWFGSADGLNKYDGVQMKIYRHLNTTQSLSNFFTDLIAEDTNGNLWIGSRNGLHKYNFAKDYLEQVFLNNPNFEMNRWIDVLGIDPKQNIWCWDRYRNFCCYNPITKSTKLIPINQGKPLFKQALYDADGYIWFNSSDGLCRYDINTGKFGIYMQSFFAEEKIRQINYIAKDDDGLIWITDFNHLICFDSKTLQQKPIPDVLKAWQSELTVVKYCNKLLWLGSAKRGLLSYNKITGGVTYYKHVNYNKESIATDNISAIYCDRASNLWVATDGFGLNRADLKPPKFKLYNSDIREDLNFESNFIKCFYMDASDRLWIGTYAGGINVFDRKTNEIDIIKTKSEKGNSVAAITKDRFGNLLIASDIGIELIDEHNLKRTLVPFDGLKEKRNSFPYPFPSCLYETKEGVLVAATSNGLYYAEYKDKKPLVFKLMDCSVGYEFGSIFQTTDRRIWVSSIQGGFLHTLKCENKLWTISPGIFKGMNIHCFYEDTVNDILWMGSENGLISYGLKSGKTNFVNERKGMANNHIYGLLPDKEGRLWMSTNKGITCYDPLRNSCRNYDVNDGLQSNEFNTGAYFKSLKGEFFFGGINGFNSFFPEEVKDNPNQPPLALCHFMVNDEEVTSFGNPACLSKIDLTYSENTLSFDFAALEFTMQEKNQYRYKLIGTDKDWVNSGNKHFARYSNLRPGTYRLVVMAANNDGVWSNEKLLCIVNIAPPWWQTWWAILCLLLTIGVVSYAIVRNFINRKLKEQQRTIEKQRALEEERNRISKDMHDDLGSGLSKIAIMSELLKGSFRDKQEIEAIGKISRTANELVDNMSQIIWAMNPDNDPIENVLGNLRKFSLDFFEDSLIRCELDFPELPGPLALPQSVRRNLFLVIKETFHNILKHSGASLVIVKVNMGNRLMQVVISDNGKGFDLNLQKLNGNGLSNMKKRMQAINGDFKLKSIVGEGTVTTLEINI